MKHKSRLITILLLVIFLALLLPITRCSRQEPEVSEQMEFPTELPSDFIGPTKKYKEQLYLPLVQKDGVRFGLAYGAWKDGQLNNNVDIHAKALGLSGNYPWHNWSLYGSKAGDFVPFVYSPQYVPAFCSMEYHGDVIFANECDLTEQCNASTGQVVQMALDMLACNPDITLIGPAYSAEDYGQLSLDFYEGYISEGGDPDKLEPSLHLYPYALDDPSERLNRFYSFYMAPTGQNSKRVHVTEIGWQGCFSTSIFTTWMNELSKDARIDTLYGFSPRIPYPQDCSFTPLVVNGKATDVGLIFGGISNRRAYP